MQRTALFQNYKLFKIDYGALHLLGCGILVSTNINGALHLSQLPGGWWNSKIIPVSLQLNKVVVIPRTRIGVNFVCIYANNQRFEGIT